MNVSHIYYTRYLPVIVVDTPSYRTIFLTTIPTTGEFIKIRMFKFIELLIRKFDLARKIIRKKATRILNKDQPYSTYNLYINNH